MSAKIKNIKKIILPWLKPSPPPDRSGSPTYIRRGMWGVSGFSIIEALVALVILGIMVTFTVSVYNKLYNNPKLLLRGEALTLANQEMDRTLSLKLITDTLYSNDKKNLVVMREIQKAKDQLYKINVKVLFSNGNKEIVSITSYSGF